MSGHSERGEIVEKSFSDSESCAVKLNLRATQESLEMMQSKIKELAQILQEANSLLSELTSYKLEFYVES